MESQVNKVENGLITIAKGINSNLLKGNNNEIAIGATFLHIFIILILSNTNVIRDKGNKR